MLLDIARIGSVLMLSVCAGLAQAADPITIHDNFANGSLNWSADFADYPAGEEENYELTYGFKRLPAYLATNRFAINLSGFNHSDDLSMFMRKKVSALKPNTWYDVTFNIRIASNAPKDAVGVGGAPGESVYVKAGVTTIRPFADPTTRLMNIDKGNQSQAGDDAQVIGHVGVDVPVGSNEYRFKTLRNRTPFRYKSNARGEGWLYLATDSGFEGTTNIYVVETTYTFTPVQ